MRTLPDSQQLNVNFSDLTIAATSNIAFEAVHTDDIEKTEHITVEAGRRGTWIIEFTPQINLPAGTKIVFYKLENEFRFAWRHQNYWPDAMDYVSVENNKGEKLEFQCETWNKSRIPALVTLTQELTKNESIIVRMGDQREGGIGSYVSPTSYDAAHIQIGVKLIDEQQYRIAKDATVKITVVPCSPLHRYFFYAPSTVEPNTQFNTVIQGTDINNNTTPLKEDAQLTNVKNVIQTDYAFNNTTLHKYVSLTNEEIIKLKLEDKSNNITASSNPIKVSSNNEYNVYWGEFHWHGYDAEEINMLNDKNHPNKAFKYGRDVTRLDFCAMGSHIFREAPDAVHKWWELYREAAKKYNEDNNYVTFMGCEWRDKKDKGGDRNIVWRDLDVPAPDPTWNIEQVYKQCKQNTSLVIPHVGGQTALPYFHNNEAEKFCEMVSGHGNFEWFAQSYLQKGYKVGLIGGSDGHMAEPGHPRQVARTGGRFFNTLRQRDSGWSGGPLLGVLASNLNRESLWEAFMNRRVYASTGARALVDFKVNDNYMGSEIVASKDIKIDFSFVGTAPIERIDLIRNEFCLQTWYNIDSDEIKESLVDNPPNGMNYYYLRFEQNDGEFIWTSPIWVKSSCNGSNEGLAPWNKPVDINLMNISDNEASKYLNDLIHYLQTEENFECFANITPYKVVNSPLGKYAVFLGFLNNHRIRIHWFFEFEIPRIRLEAGWVHYGRERIAEQEWTRPLFANQEQ